MMVQRKTKKGGCTLETRKQGPLPVLFLLCFGWTWTRPFFPSTTHTIAMWLQNCPRDHEKAFFRLISCLSTKAPAIRLDDMQQYYFTFPQLSYKLLFLVPSISPLFWVLFFVRLSVPRSFFIGFAPRALSTAAQQKQNHQLLLHKGFLGNCVTVLHNFFLMSIFSLSFQIMVFSPFDCTFF